MVPPMRSIPTMVFPAPSQNYPRPSDGMPWPGPNRHFFAYNIEQKKLVFSCESRSPARPFHHRGQRRPGLVRLRRLPVRYDPGTRA